MCSASSSGICDTIDVHENKVFIVSFEVVKVAENIENSRQIDGGELFSTIIQDRSNSIGKKTENDDL